jgi:hypothetical protein
MRRRPRRREKGREEK